MDILNSEIAFNELRDRILAMDEEEKKLAVSLMPMDVLEEEYIRRSNHPEILRVKKWVDRIVEHIVSIKRLENLNMYTEILAPDSIVVTSGIDVIANAVGGKLTEEKRENSDTYTYLLEYQGITFMQFSVERLGADDVGIDG